MSRLLDSITGALGQLFRKFWGDPTPPKLPEPSEPPVPEEEPEVESDGENEYETASESPEEETESDGESEYETASSYQNTETRWYSAIWRFLFWKKQGNNVEFYDGSTQWTGSE